MSSTLPFESIAPLELQNLRTRRYLGDDAFVELPSLAPVDQELIRLLYTTLKDLLGLLGSDPETREGRSQAVAEWTEQLDVETFVRKMRTLGNQSVTATNSELIAKTIHDVRGGGLTPLLCRLQLLIMEPDGGGDINALFFLTRDHLKIMRNALSGLDDEQREADMITKLHGVDLLVEKWQGAELSQSSRQTRIHVDCRFNGSISECCLEFGALDRILYNLMNNARRHALRPEIGLAMYAVPDESGENLRFVVSNTVSEADVEKLRAMGNGADNLAALFTPGVSSTGSGLGMTIVADFVANAFGLSTRECALEGRYLGARVVGEEFVAWFHWPIATGY